MHINCLTIFILLLLLSILNTSPTFNLETNDANRKVSYKGYQLWTLNTDTTEKAEAVQKLDIVEVTRWGLNRTDGDVLIKNDHLKKVRDDLKKYDISHKVLIDNLQGIIDEQPIEDVQTMKLSQKIETFNLSQYHNFPVIRNYLIMLAKAHNHLKLITIGKTLLNNPIDVVTINNGGNRGIFIEAGIHAREWISHAVVIFILNTFAKDFRKEIEAIQKLDWHFLPLGNPDGYIYSYTKDRLWRKNRSKWGNCFGTDLNRNFGFQWDYGSQNPCEETFSGNKPFSEMETIAIRNYIQKFNSKYWKAYISIHSYGQYVLYPYGFTKMAPNNINELQSIAKSVIGAVKQTHKSDYTACSVADLYIAAGVSIDWTKSIGIKYSFAFELRDTGKYAFLLPPKQIIPTAEELLNGIRVIASAINDL